MPERRRYCLDIARELHFLKVRDALLARLAASPYPGAPLDKRKYKSTEPGSAAGGYTLGDTLRYWKFAKQIEQFSDAYAAGRLDDAGRVLRRCHNKACNDPRHPRAIPTRPLPGFSALHGPLCHRSRARRLPVPCRPRWHAPRRRQRQLVRGPRHLGLLVSVQPCHHRSGASRGGAENGREHSRASARGDEPLWPRKFTRTGETLAAGRRDLWFALHRRRAGGIRRGGGTSGVSGHSEGDHRGLSRRL